MDQAPSAVLRRHHKELLSAKRGRGKQAQFKVFYGPDGPETITLGRRCSDRYGRIYDKWLESRDEAFRNCLRYELELHRHLAYRQAKILDSQELDQASILGPVNAFMSVRGIRVDRELEIAPSLTNNASENSENGSLYPRYRPPVPEVVRVLRWMRNSVRPSVQRLIESGYEREMLDAVGLLKQEGGAPYSRSVFDLDQDSSEVQ